MENNLQQLFVLPPLAILAKKYNFNEPCFGYYFNNEFKYCDRIEKPSTHTNTSLNDDNCFSSPLYQQLVDWFREEHKIFIEVGLHAADFKQEFRFDIYRLKIEAFENPREGYNPFIETGNDVFYSTYYEAITTALEQSFKLIKNK